MSTVLDLTGHRYGRLDVIKRSPIDYIYKLKSGKIKQQPQWECLCDCGSTLTVKGTHLRTGNTTSCGCKRIEQPNAMKHGFRSNGQFDYTYNCWSYFRKRDELEQQWLEFAVFLRAVGPRPTDKHELKRHDIRELHGPTNTYWRDPNATQPTHTDLGDEFFLDMRGAFTRSVETIEKGTRATKCISR